MKKLLQATSAVALILMSSQAFASLQYSEAEENQIRNSLAAQGNTVEQTNRYINFSNDLLQILSSKQNPENQAPAPQVSASNSDDDVLSQVRNALTQSGMSYEDINDLLAEQFSNNEQEVVQQEPAPASAPVPQASVVSVVAPAPTIEEAVKKVSVLMVSLKDRSSDYYQFFQVIYYEMHNEMNKTGSKSKDYALQQWINKDLENRLYYPAVWNQFIRKSNDWSVHDPKDKAMAPAHVQVSNLHALYYNAMNKKHQIGDEYHQIQIKDLEAIGSQDTRSTEEIIQSMSDPNAQLTNAQKTTGHIMGFWKRVNF